MSDEVKAIDEFVVKYNEFKNEIGKVIVGQDAVVQQVLISIFCNGHCLLVGVPGLAKTLLVQTIADSLIIEKSSTKLAVCDSIFLVSFKIR